MAQPFKAKTVAIVTREGLKSTADILSETMDRLHSVGFRIYTVSPLQHRYATSVKSILDLKCKRLDFVVSIGGDGTIIRVMRELDNGTPVLSIAAGGRGIMAELRPDELPQAFENLSKGEYFLDRRMKLNTTIYTKTLPPALNEVLVIRRGYTSTPTYTISIGNRLKLSQRMDGLMVTTPTGSTGHSYTLDGPVISEVLNIFLLTPVCPISKLPPLILPALPVGIMSDQPMTIVVDGQEVYRAEGGTTIKVMKHHQDAVFIRFSRRFLRQLVNLGFS